MGYNGVQHLENTIFHIELEDNICKHDLSLLIMFPTAFYGIWVVMIIAERLVTKDVALWSQVYSLELELSNFIANYRYCQTLGHLFKDVDS